MIYFKIVDEKELYIKGIKNNMPEHTPNLEDAKDFPIGEMFFAYPLVTVLTECGYQGTSNKQYKKEKRK